MGEDAKKIIRNRRLKWMGHDVRMDKNRIANEVMSYDP